MSRRERWPGVLLLGAVVALRGAFAYGDPPRRTTATGGGVRLSGEARSSSVEVPREPWFQLANTTGAPRAVEFLSLVALGPGGERRTLRITGPRRITLAGHARRRVEVEFTGQPIHMGGGLSYYRFALTVAVEGVRLEAVASGAYVCRIPMRHLSTP